MPEIRGQPIVGGNSLRKQPESIAGLCLRAGLESLLGRAHSSPKDTAQLSTAGAAAAQGGRGKHSAYRAAF